VYGRRWNPLDVIVRWGDAPVAFMECWENVWPITITKNEGWNGAASEDDNGSSLLGKLMQERGTNGRPCGSPK
jgi:hypothetical protein